MLKQTVAYTDYNDESQVETLYFNLTKTELIDLLDTLPRMEAWTAKVAGPDRLLTSEEIKEMLDIIKILIERSYGVRSEDGKFFRKSPELFADFKESAVYDAFVFYLFEDLDNANNFIVKIMPKGLAEEAQAEIKKNTESEQIGRVVEQVELPETSNEMDTTEVEIPAYMRENRLPNKEEFANMTPQEQATAFQWKINSQ